MGQLLRVLLLTRTTAGRQTPGKVPGSIPARVAGNRPSQLRGRVPGKRDESPRLGGFLAAAMVVARPILMGSPPPRPLTDQRGRGGSRPDEAGQEMTGFRG